MSELCAVCVKAALNLYYCIKGSQYAYYQLLHYVHRLILDVQIVLKVTLFTGTPAACNFHLQSDFPTSLAIKIVFYLHKYTACKIINTYRT